MAEVGGKLAAWRQDFNHTLTPCYLEFLSGMLSLLEPMPIVERAVARLQQGFHMPRVTPSASAMALNCRRRWAWQSCEDPEPAMVSIPKAKGRFLGVDLPNRRGAGFTAAWTGPRGRTASRTVLRASTTSRRESSNVPANRARRWGSFPGDAFQRQASAWKGLQLFNLFNL